VGVKCQQHMPGPAVTLAVGALHIPCLATSPSRHVRWDTGLPCCCCTMKPLETCVMMTMTVVWGSDSHKAFLPALFGNKIDHHMLLKLPVVSTTE
jgi:hypothetical protein